RLIQKTLVRLARNHRGAALASFDYGFALSQIQAGHLPATVTGNALLLEDRARPFAGGDGLSQTQPWLDTQDRGRGGKKQSVAASGHRAGGCNPGAVPMGSLPSKASRRKAMVTGRE